MLRRGDGNSVHLRSASIEWGMPDRPPAPTARPSAPAGARSRRAEAPGVAAARTTIPTCIVLGLLLPVLGIVAFALPETSALKPTGNALPIGLLVLGVGAAVAAAVLMAHVARHAARPARRR